MPYLIDTDWIIDYLANDPDALSLLQRFVGDGIAISVITYLEVAEGTLRSADPEDARRNLHSLTAAIPLLPISQAVAWRCATIRAELRARRRRVNQRAYDLLIAATAIEHDLTLVTRNTRDYWDIPDLKLQSP